MPKNEKKKAKRAEKLAEEALPSDPGNSLFGSRPAEPAAPAAEPAPAPAPAPAKPKKRQASKSTSDPAVHIIAANKRAKYAQDSEQARPPTAPSKSFSVSQKAVHRPHADVVEQVNRLWEKLRADKTGDAERAELIDEVLALFAGKVLEFLQKHDAARVLQSCFKQGSAAQRDALMGSIKGEARNLARSHYGHFLLISIVRHGTAAHKQLVVSELKGHVAELLVHAEGSAIVQLLYTDVANGKAQRDEMYRELWGKLELFGPGATKMSSLGQLFATDPLCKDRVLRRLEVLISKASRKGLAVTALVQRAVAELLVHGTQAQRAELVGLFRESGVHIMHTRDGARIAAGVLRHGDAKDRKALLKAMKGYVSPTAQSPNATLVLCVALEAVDDTVLLGKGVLSELIADVATLALHPQGTLPLLSLLAPRSPRYFTPEQLEALGELDPAASKKDPARRRAELLKLLLPSLLAACAEQAAVLAVSPHGEKVLFETLRVAGEAAELELELPAGADAKLLSALAAAALTRPPAEAELHGTRHETLLSHHHSARLLKRAVQARAEFGSALLPRLKGKLASHAKSGAGWIVLALLECSSTQKEVAAELAGKAGAIGKCEAAGCKNLAAKLKELK